MIKLKHGVKLRGIRPEMVLGHGIVASVFDRYGLLGCTITSANDSQHGSGSLHFNGSALDYRTRDFYPEIDKTAFTSDIKDALGPEFDVVLESDHIHVEYQPKD